MIAIKIAALVFGLLALIITFKAKPIAQKLFGEERAEGMVLRVKYAALVLAVIAFLAVFIFGR